MIKKTTNMNRKDYDETLNMFNVFREKKQELIENSNSAKRLLKETSDDELENEEKSDGGGIPYTMQDSLMSSITQTAKTQFGANFSGLKNPMLYYPEDGDVTLSGTIPGMGGDVKFQFRYKDASGNGCFIWSNYLALSEDTLLTLKKIHGVYKNWKQSLSSAEDIKPMKYKDKKD